MKAHDVRRGDLKGSLIALLLAVLLSAPHAALAAETAAHSKPAHVEAMRQRGIEVRMPERTVVTLDPFGCLCSTMFRVSPNHLLWVLEGLVAGEVHNRIVVPDEQKHWTKVALDRMLSIS